MFVLLMLTEKAECLEAYYRHIERLPSQRAHVDNVVNWMKGNKPLVVEESGFLNSWDDLISPKQRPDHGGLDTFISQCIAKLAEWGFRKVRLLPLLNWRTLMCCRLVVQRKRMMNTLSWLILLS
jgi:hypothetical protein